MDGAIVCTPHSTHYAIGRELIGEGKRRYHAATSNESDLGYRPINVLMEKPMTTNVKEAKELHDLLIERQIEGSVGAGERSEANRDKNVGGGVGCFLINHSANYRAQARAARSLIQSGKLGMIRHGTSPVCFLFIVNPCFHVCGTHLFVYPHHSRKYRPSLRLRYHGFSTTRQIQDGTSLMTQEKCLVMDLHGELDVY
jgi:hypothetical protein